MFTKYEKLCILAIVIAPVLLFGYANGFTELQQQTTTDMPAVLATRIAAIATTTKTNTAPTIYKTVKEIETKEAATIINAATAKTTTITTLASSNAPATITTNVDVLQKENAQTEKGSFHNGPKQQSYEVTTPTMAAAAVGEEGVEAIPTAAEAKIMAITQKAQESSNFPSRTTHKTMHHEAVAAEGQEDEEDEANGKSSGNEAKTQIKNVKIQIEASKNTAKLLNVEQQKSNEFETPNRQETTPIPIPTTTAATTSTMMTMTTRASLIGETKQPDIHKKEVTTSRIEVVKANEKEMFSKAGQEQQQKQYDKQHEAKQPTLVLTANREENLHGFYGIRLAQIGRDEFNDLTLTTTAPILGTSTTENNEKTANINAGTLPPLQQRSDIVEQYQMVEEENAEKSNNSGNSNNNSNNNNNNNNDHVSNTRNNKNFYPDNLNLNNGNNDFTSNNNNNDNSHELNNNNGYNTNYNNNNNNDDDDDDNNDYRSNYHINNNNYNDNRKDTAPTKLNMADFYPIKMEDFNPIIRDSNAKLLKERTVFMHTEDAAEHRQNLMPNEVETNAMSNSAQIMQGKTVNRIAVTTSNPTTATKTTEAITSVTTTTMTQSAALEKSNNKHKSISDFTGKLLAEQDGVITEIEQKFRFNDDLATSTTTTTPTNATSTTSNALEATTSEKSNVNAAATTQATTRAKEHKKYGFTINHKIHTGVGHDFIDRRVKKSFDFPMHRIASDAMSVPHIDFANTKFNGDDANVNVASARNTANNGSALNDKGAAALTGAAHPEFSTTKFYNSKELYNELMQQHNKLYAKAKATAIGTAPSTTTSSTSNISTIMESSMPHGSSAASRFANLRNDAKFKKTLPKFKDFVKQAVEAAAANKEILTLATTTQLPPLVMPIRRVTPMPAVTTTTTTTTSTATIAAADTTRITTAKPVIKFTKDLSRTKLLLKAMFPNSGAASTTTKTNSLRNINTAATTVDVTNASATTFNSTTAGNILASLDQTSASVTASRSIPTTTATATDIPSTFAFVSKLPTTTSTTTTTTTTTTIATLTSTPAAADLASATKTPLTLQRHSISSSSTTSNSAITIASSSTNPSKSTSKPIARPRILSRLQEKINSLECEIQNLPLDAHLWRGNETHELLLPIVSPESCKSIEDCSTPLVISWEGEAEIQSGDILIVEINDILLHPNDKNTTNIAHNTQVYQVTRSGHEHCDVTEGILLDITPLVVDGRKLVTLYDKDLTEGVNLLIVVSELWGSQCVRLKVTTKTDNCGENADCSGKGVCYSNAAMEEYECQCCSGFAGPHCEEIDACTPSPCTNNGICVDLSQGHEGNSYQCLCPYGYIGKNCQYESDPCNPTECLNGGSCVGNSTHFRCDCTPGYTGPLCQHSLNECESSPCVHGICVDQEDGFRCFCQPGFAGELCNFEYNECESNPCQNNGECIDHIGSYECRCTKGYTGNRCQIKVDFCANKPCPEGHHCIDHGNDFSCECPGGRNGPDCNQMPRTQCNVNPCTHGGTCWSSGDSFYCACRPGYTGTMCEDEFVVETVVSSSEFMVDDTNAKNFNDKTFGSSVVLKSPIELHNAYFAAGVLAAAIFIVAIVVTICHCKVNQTYRKFSTRSTTFFPILGFGRRPKSQGKLNKHWLSGKGLGTGNPLRSSSSSTSLTRSHLPASNGNQYTTTGGTSLHNNSQLHERPFQRHLAMNLENDMYYTVDFSENSQHSPLIQ